MKIAIIGYGKMGKRIEEIALESGHEIAAIIDPAGSPERKSLSGTPIETFLTHSTMLSRADVAIEFSQPQTAADNIKELSHRQIPVVVGTTNWYDKLDDIRMVIKLNGSSLLYAPNFSLGVNIFYRIAAYAAKLMDSFPEYDAGGFEVHHNEKMDSPSGTAKVLAEKVVSQMKRKTTPVWQTLDRKPAPHEFHFPSLRVGAVPGTHTIIFDSQSDSIEITHTARNRDGLALGAVRGAEWLISETPLGEKRRGVFTIDDFLDDFLTVHPQTAE